MANDVNHLIDMLYGMIDEAKSTAFGQGKCTINRDEALDLLDEIRAQMPVELKRAQELLRAREEYVESAKRDVDRMMRQAELEAKGFTFDPSTAKYLSDGTLNAIYLTDEICGFAVHLVGKK